MNEKLFRVVIPIFIIACATVIFYNIYTAPTSGNQDNKSVPRYPSDVDEVLQKFNYNEINDGVSLTLSGSLAVRRGKKILGFRSTLLKEVYIDNLAGEWSAKQERIRFSAKKSTWDMRKETPLLLKEGVTVAVNGVTVKGVNFVKIYLSKKEMEIYTDRISVVHIQ
jgi:hypothetical protein